MIVVGRPGVSDVGDREILLADVVLGNIPGTSYERVFMLYGGRGAAMGD